MCIRAVGSILAKWYSLTEATWSAVKRVLYTIVIPHKYVNLEYVMLPCKNVMFYN